MFSLLLLYSFLLSRRPANKFKSRFSNLRLFFSPGLTLPTMKLGTLLTTYDFRSWTSPSLFKSISFLIDSNFDIKSIANYNEKERVRLLNDRGIVRNQLKIDAFKNRILEKRKNLTLSGFFFFFFFLFENFNKYSLQIRRKNG